MTCCCGLDTFEGETGEICGAVRPDQTTEDQNVRAEQQLLPAVKEVSQPRPGWAFTVGGKVFCYSYSYLVYFYYRSTLGVCTYIWCILCTEIYIYEYVVY